MRTAFFSLAILAVVTATVFAETRIKDAAAAGAPMAAELSSIPRFKLAADDPVDEVKELWEKTITAVYSDISQMD